MNIHCGTRCGWEDRCSISKYSSKLVHWTYWFSIADLWVNSVGPNITSCTRNEWVSQGRSECNEGGQSWQSILINSNWDWISFRVAVCRDTKGSCCAIVKSDRTRRCTREDGCTIGEDNSKGIGITEWLPVTDMCDYWVGPHLRERSRCNRIAASIECNKGWQRGEITLVGR